MIHKAIRRLRRTWTQARLRRASELERIDFYPEVKHGGQVRLTGNVNFGSEPFLISLGSNITIADGVRFVNHDGGARVFRAQTPNLHVYGRIDVGDDVFIGVNVILLPGVTIGNQCVIGAGSIVTRDVPSGEVWAGVPARRIKYIEEYRDGLASRAVDWPPGDYGVEWMRHLSNLYPQPRLPRHN